MRVYAQCGTCGTHLRDIVLPTEWEQGSAYIWCSTCDKILPQDELQMTDPGLPVSACFLWCSGLRSSDLVLGVSRKDDHAEFGLPGGKHDPEDGSLGHRDFLRTLQRTVARETGEETGVWLDPARFDVVYQGVCTGGKDGKAYWQVVLTHPDDDWTARQQPGEGKVDFVPWSTILAGPFGDFNGRLLTALRRSRGS